MFEFFLRIQGYNLDKAGEFLKGIQLKKAEGFEVWQDEKKWEIVKHHFNNNPFYRFKIGSLPADWEDIPELRKHDYQGELAERLSKGYAKSKVYIASTSGSSGTPFFFAKDKFSHALAWALIKDRYSQYGITLNSLQARFYGLPFSGLSHYKEKLKDVIMNRHRFNVFDLSAASMDNFIETFKRKRFEYIYGYTNTITYFCRHLLDRGVILKKICPSLKVVVVTSEMCSKEDANLIEQATGVAAANEYGASEAGIISFQYPDNTWRTSDELLYLETNAKGELLITSLFNKAFPIIRYNIGDVVQMEKKQTASSTVQCITSIMGRSDDLIKLPGNNFAPGLTVYYCSRSILEKSSFIKELYVTQNEINRFTIFYIAESDIDEKLKNIIQKAFDSYLVPGLHLSFSRVDTIRRKANGKLQMFYSEL